MSKLPFNEALPESTQSYQIQAWEDEWKASKKISTSIYFDTYDVVRMLQGIWGFWSFNNGNKINTHLFDEPVTLVHSLASEGKLDTIHMLAPHQDEMLLKLKDSTYLFPSKKDPNFVGLDDDLLYNVGLMELYEQAQSNDLDDNAVREYGRSLKTKAYDLYKATEMIRTPFWLDRYKRFTQKNILKIDDSSYDFVHVVQSKEFTIFKEALDNHRENYGKSNFIDAIAFCLLTQKLNDFKSDRQKNALPIFFASRKGTYNALKEVETNYPEMLTYTMPGFQSTQIPIIRKAQFFILDAIFKPEDQNTPLHKLLVELRAAIDNRVVDYNFLKRTLNKENPDELEKNIIEDINDFFFQGIWLQNEGCSDMYNSVRSNEQYRKIAEKEEADFKKQREQIAGQNERNTQKFAIINDVLKEFSEIDNIISRRYKKGISLNINSDLAMTRFSFSENCAEEIQSIVDRLFDNQNQMDNLRLCIADIVGRIFNGIYRKNHADLAVSLGVFWVFDKYRLINNIGKKLEKGFDNFQVPLLYAASMIKGGERNQKRVEEIANCIESKFPENGHPSYKVGIGLSFIYWLLWDAKQNHPKMPELMMDPVNSSFRNKPNFKWAEKSIELLQKAIHFLAENKDSGTSDKVIAYRNERYFYAINVYLFVITQTAHFEKFDSREIAQYVGLLQGVRQTPDYWQPRFGDTLARYYLRKALNAKDAEGFDTYLAMAFVENERSIESSKLDETFDHDLKTIMTQLKTDGFSSWTSKR